MKSLLFAVAVGVFTLSAQDPTAPSPTQTPAEPDQVQQTTGKQPIYKVNVVARTIPAVNYRYRSGWTKIDLRGTPLLPEAKGSAKVKSGNGVVEIDADMEKLQPATRFGPEYLTYVLWAITPEGRARNLGEVMVGDDGKARISPTTDLPSFGMIVTAEPYFGVTQPSDVVVMENFTRNTTKGEVQDVNARFELLQRGQYVAHGNPAELPARKLEKNVPLDLYEARNAVKIAQFAGADRYAPEVFQRAQQQLSQAETYLSRKAGKPIVTEARQVVQTAEDARVIALRRQADEQAAAERHAQAEAQARSKAEAERAAQLQAQAEANQRAEEQRRAVAEAERAKAEADQRAAKAEAESARLAAAQADQQRQQAENEKNQLREQLRQQLNAVLETKETARGLIVNMSDVLFDTAKYTLKPGAREKLSRIAGIALAHPGLKFEVEGFTDSTGTPEFNHRLSERRAETVRDYLVSQGLPADTIASRGFGEADPVATNSTSAGRQQNRRVELVVSGDIIGRTETARQQPGQVGQPPQPPPSTDAQPR